MGGGAYMIEGDPQPEFLGKIHKHRYLWIFLNLVVYVH